MSSAYAPVRKLVAADAVENFDCGQTALNQFLQRYALLNQKANSAQTYVCCHASEVVGFYSLAVGSVEP
ncbi:MAG TPA: GNAT family N-acetyltransferase, partial [Rhodocyclaceae bacterium]|nr:GNAT family N-acetyltransferase [Rhodocyclaceae bacterium]